MHNHAFIPAPVVLKGRFAPSSGPVHLSGLGFDLTLARVRGNFEQFSLSGNLGRRRTQLAGLAKTIPFGRSDGLGSSVNSILNFTRTDLASHGAAGRPIATAPHQVNAAIGTLS